MSPESPSNDSNKQERKISCALRETVVCHCIQSRLSSEELTKWHYLLQARSVDEIPIPRKKTERKVLDSPEIDLIKNGRSPRKHLSTCNLRKSWSRRIQCRSILAAGSNKLSPFSSSYVRIPQRRLHEASSTSVCIGCFCNIIAWAVETTVVESFSFPNANSLSQKQHAVRIIRQSSRKRPRFQTVYARHEKLSIPWLEDI